MMDSIDNYEVILSLETLLPPDIDSNFLNNCTPKDISASLLDFPTPPTPGGIHQTNNHCWYSCYNLCKSVGKYHKIGDIPRIELDRLLGHFYAEVQKNNREM